MATRQIKDYYYVVSSTVPSLSLSESDAEAVTRQLKGEFKKVCRDVLDETMGQQSKEERRYYIFHFHETVKASEVGLDDFPITMQAVPVAKIFEPRLKSHRIRIRIDMMAVADFKEALQALKDHVEQFGVNGFQQKVDSCQNSVEVKELKELSLNQLVTDEVFRVAGSLGYVVETNKTNLFQTLGSLPHNTSRYSSSRPDLFMYHHENNIAYMIADKNTLIATENGKDIPIPQNTLFAAATENKKSRQYIPIPQLLANMEKVAGDVVWYWLRFGNVANKLFECMIIFGLIIDYEKKSCSTYKLVIDFQTRGSTLYIGSESLPIEDGINRLFSSLEKVVSPIPAFIRI